jgi:hypothetical protein
MLLAGLRTSASGQSTRDERGRLQAIVEVRLPLMFWFLFLPAGFGRFDRVPLRFLFTCTTSLSLSVSFSPINLHPTSAFKTSAHVYSRGNSFTVQVEEKRNRELMPQTRRRCSCCLSVSMQHAHTRMHFRDLGATSIDLGRAF